MSEVRQEKNAPQTGANEREPKQEGVHPNAPKTAAEAWRIREEALDRTIEDTFPSSDPPSSIPDPSEGEEAA